MREPRALVEAALVLYRWHVVPPSPAHSWSHVLGQPIRDQRRGMTTLARQPQPGTPDVPPYRNSESMTGQDGLSEVSFLDRPIRRVDRVDQERRWRRSGGQTQLRSASRAIVVRL
jgi:hypothetical protein